MKCRAGKTGTALDAMRVKLTPSLDPSRTKLDGSRSGKSSALMSVSARTGPAPAGVMVKPVLSLSKLRYLLVTLLSVALGAVWAAGEFADVAVMVLPGTVATTPEVSAGVVKFTVLPTYKPRRLLATKWN